MFINKGLTLPGGEETSLFKNYESNIVENIIDYIFKCRDLEFEEKPNYDMLINIMNKKIEN